MSVTLHKYYLRPQSKSHNAHAIFGTWCALQRRYIGIITAVHQEDVSVQVVSLISSKTFSAIEALINFRVSLDLEKS